MIEDIRYIEEHLPLSERLAQLAEEAAELAQAALKMRRALPRMVELCGAARRKAVMADVRDI